MSNKKPVVLFAVLNWGLGHATRSIPLINQLLYRGVCVVLAGNGDSGQLLKMNFPELAYYELPGYKIRYASRALMPWMMLRNLSFIFRAVAQEKTMADAIIKKEAVDVIISDNRYGMYHPACKNVLISHQLAPLLPTPARPFSTLFYKKYTELLIRFDRIWIPDTADRFFSGMLSTPRIPLPDVRFIGPQSRFSMHRKPAGTATIPLLAILSGPEPQRSYLEEKLIHEARKHQKKLSVIAGKPGSQHYNSGHIRILPHLNDTEFLEQVDRAEKIIMRSGYSSIMDMYAIGKGAILVPTPGQTEQEYLAEIHSKKGPFRMIAQKDLNLKKLPALPERKPEEINRFSKEALSSAIDEILDELQFMQ